MSAKFKRFRSPGTVIGRFVARRTMRSAALWAVAFGVVVASKSAGYAAAYPSLADRSKLALSFSGNVGLEALLGIPHHIETVDGFAVWNTLGLMAIIGSIWALLLATKTFRGEEDSGRWELLLTGQTTARRAAANTLAGLSFSLLVLYAIASIIFTIVGRAHNVDFGLSGALFFALGAAAGAAMFMSVGALASQLMPTRSRAAGLSAGIFGASFLLRAMADTTSAHWLLNITPLGWIEKLQPLYNSQPIWLLPIAGLIAVCGGLTIWLAGRRDLEASVFPDKDSALARTRLLNRTLPFSVRLVRMTSFSWLLALGTVSLFFSLLTKSAAGAVSSSSTADKVLSRLAQAAQLNGAKLFLGIAFFLLTTLTMVCVTNAVGAIREEEAQGYLDNLLVRSVSRMRWLGDRLAILLVLILSIVVVGCLASWVGTSSQHAGLAFYSLLLASLNLLAPAVLIAGIAIAALGLVPRLTTVVAYSVIAWSFLIQILASGLNLSHWVIDTSILHHVALAPAVNPDWKAAAILSGLGLGLMIIGAAAFNNRDLAAE